MLVEYHCMAADCQEEIFIEQKGFKPFIRCPTCRSVMQITNIEEYYKDIKDPRLREMHIRADLSHIAKCPFTYDCHLHDVYEESCEYQHHLTHKCLVQFDTQLCHISNMLKSILEHLEK